ncbi:MAG TPA: type I-B CRISPR-associated protein Cas5 [Candidatus Syntrophoarchaeum butanivorans]|uniref:Type I-B CRISPR-associated protein Cas5 n=1 Tax=Candidatus Syntropharchaeum butanivorans TaxID=1839936 RepID=A0A7J2S1K7_9EURY|nr:type I-B CRISPR-associated protein Cas5 [Candidatus Syntrophoarchaeum butanivorans]
MTDKVIIFDVWGDYAHFRKIYTTSSPLSYSFPPRTTIAGLIGAIAGIDKEEYLGYFTKDRANIACRILSPIKKVRIGENLINTKDGYFIPVRKTGHQPRTQVRFEFIKDPKYRIYFSHSDEKLYEKVKNHLKNHQSVYTPSLGLSELICNFSYRGEFKVSLKSVDEFIPIDSVVPSRYFRESPEFEVGKEYFSETVPLEMTEGRKVVDYGEVLFERNGREIMANVTNFWEVGDGEQIIFL